MVIYSSGEYNHKPSWKGKRSVPEPAAVPHDNIYRNSNDNHDYNCDHNSSVASCKRMKMDNVAEMQGGDGGVVYHEQLPMTPDKISRQSYGNDDHAMSDAAHSVTPMDESKLKMTSMFDRDDGHSCRRSLSEKCFQNNHVDGKRGGSSVSWWMRKRSAPKPMIREVEEYADWKKFPERLNSEQPVYCKMCETDICDEANLVVYSFGEKPCCHQNSILYMIVAINAFICSKHYCKSCLTRNYDESSVRFMCLDCERVERKASIGMFSKDDSNDMLID